MENPDRLKSNPPRVLFQFSGSVAGFKACALVSRLVQAGYEVQTVASRAAREFIGPSTLEGLTGRPVLTDLFEPGRAMEHIRLARWADLTLLCPASAGAINRLAQGLADDCIGTLFLAHEFPRQGPAYWIVPAMNPAMWAHPATRASLEKLRSWKIRVVEPGAGHLACGEEGDGRLAEPDKLFELIEEFIGEHSGERFETASQSAKGAAVLHSSPAASSSSRRLRVLITSGATREPIDRVRFLTNFSTGATGAAIADAFSASGHDVVYLHGEHAAQPRHPVLTEEFESFSDLDDSLRRLLGGEPFDVVIHAAAVSDYSIAAVEGAGDRSADGKLPSDRAITLRLKPCFKIVERLRSYAQARPLVLVAFKLTDGGDEIAQVRSLLERAQADFVVHNRRSDVSPSRHITTIYGSNGEALIQRADKTGLASALVEQVIDRIEDSDLAPSIRARSLEQSLERRTET